MSCVAAGTFVLSPDGPVLIEMLTVGDEIVTVDEVAHRIGGAATVRARVLAVHQRRADELIDVGGVLAAPAHRWAVVRDQRATFAPVDDLRGARVRTCALGETELRAAPPLATARPAEIVFNVTTSARTYAVAASPDGPFYVVHS